MNYTRVMKELKACGTAQNRKVYARHGAKEPMFGVSFANIKRIRKDVLRVPGEKRKYNEHDHDLALKLWKSGNHDARALGTMIADPEQMTSSELDRWIRDCDDYGMEGMVVGLAAKTRHAQAKMKKWRKSRREFTAAAGWNLLVELAQFDKELPDSFFVPYLAEIKESIHQGQNRARHAMNAAVIAIGGRSPNLRRRAIAAAKRIGKVDVDHGATGCKTPEAIPYIERIWERKSKKSA